jgi:hypothetical protein
MMKISLFLASVLVLAFPMLAFADDTITYRSEGGCNGDFDRVEMKSYFLRVDSGDGGHAGSMIYDHSEKVAYFIDHGSHTFMQTELDEDAIDLQGDIMKSLRTKMRREGGVDPFELAKSLCPGMGASTASRDRLPDEPVDCGNGTTIGGAPAGANGKPMSRDEMMAAMKNGEMPALDANTQAMMQKMMEQQMARMTPEQRAEMQRGLASGGMAMMPGMPGAGASAAPPPSKPARVDRDAGEAEVGGIACLRRQHLRGGELVREDCYAAASGLHLGEVETRRIARFTKAMRAWSESLVPDGAKSESDDRVLVRRICYAGGHESGRATLAIDTAPIGAARFEVPAGYKPVDLMGSAGARGGD